jgi:hypothetical protein
MEAIKNKEIFKPIVEFNGAYHVSNFGNIKTFNWRNTGREAIIKPAKDKKGYLRVGLILNGKLVTRKVHRLVGITFIPNPENKPQINHKDTIKANNFEYNLEWATNSENQIHAIKNGCVKSRMGIKRPYIKAKGEDNENSKLKEFQVLEIRKRFKKRICTREMLGKEYNVSPATIKDIVLKKSWKHI